MDIDEQIRACQLEVEDAIAHHERVIQFCPFYFFMEERAI